MNNETTMNNELSYIACPYTHPEPAVMAARFALATKHAAEMMQAGHLVYSPLTHNHPIAVAHEMPKDWDYWKRHGVRMLACCQRLVIICEPGWQKSKGVVAEFTLAKQLGLAIQYRDL